LNPGVKMHIVPGLIFPGSAGTGLSHMSFTRMDSVDRSGRDE
jgi:hypothetical protein